MPIQATTQKTRNKRTRNTSSREVVITSDKLYKKLSKHSWKLGHSYDLIGAIGFLITIITTLCTCDFKDNIVSPDVWKGMFLVLLIISIVYTVYAAIRSIRSWFYSIEDLINDIFTTEE